jgi:hypothetical protein
MRAYLLALSLLLLPACPADCGGDDSPPRCIENDCYEVEGPTSDAGVTDAASPTCSDMCVVNCGVDGHCLDLCLTDCRADGGT